MAIESSFAVTRGHSAEETAAIGVQRASYAWVLQLPTPLATRLFHANNDWLDLIGRWPDSYADRQSGTRTARQTAAARWRSESITCYGHLITTPVHGSPVESAELCSEYMAQTLALPRLLCRVYRHYWDVYEVPFGSGDWGLHYLCLAYELRRYLLRVDELTALDVWLSDNGLLATRPDAWPPIRVP
jgi:hypothetical protein